MDIVMTPEQQRIREVAENYRSKGYEVILEPQQEQLPDFLLRYRPDLLVRKGEESVVIEVKSKATLAHADDLQGLAQAVRMHPGWKFELVVTNSQALSAEEAASSLNKQDIKRILQEVAELLEKDQVEAALLLAWSTAEAALRLSALEEGLLLEQRNPLYLLKQLVTHAVVSRGDYQALLDVLELRNRVAHGFRVQDKGASRKAVGSLLAITRHLMRTNTIS